MLARRTLMKGLTLLLKASFFWPMRLVTFSGVALNSGNDGVGERPAVGALIHLLDDNNLFAGLTALEDDCDLSVAQHLVRAIGANFCVCAYLAGLVYCQSIG